MTLPITGGPEWAAAQATPWFTVNEALRYLDAFAVKSIIQDRDLAAPPGACADGARYLIAGSPTGLWSGQAGKLAIALGTNATNGWLFVTVAVEGTELWVRDEDVLIRHNGTSWQVVGGPSYTINAQTGTSYGPVLSDAQNLVTLNNASPVTVTIPNDSTVNFPVGSRLDFCQLGAGQVEIDAAGGVTLNGTPGLLLRDQYSAASAIKLSANNWVVIGDLSS